MDIEVTSEFRATYPTGVFGALLVRHCPNRSRASAIHDRQRAVEARLRARFPGETIDADPIAQAYAGHFRRYGARYPVVHQAKTILTGRAISGPSALVEVMFTAEVESLILTSGHDLDTLGSALDVDVARGGEIYTKLTEKDQAVKAGDMVVRDAAGIIACVLYGPDYRTRLRPESQAALYGAWCPTGVSVKAVASHLNGLAELLRLEWPTAQIEPPGIWTSSGA